MTVERLLQEGIVAAQAGDLKTANTLLAQVLQTDPESEQGWLWLGMCQTLAERREYCFRRVLSLNPNNTEAQRQMRSLTASPAQSADKPPRATIPPAPAMTPRPSAQASPPDAGLISATVPPAADQTNITVAGGVQPQASAQKPDPVGRPERILIAVIGVLLGLLICGGPLVYLVLSGRLDSWMVSFAAVGPTPTPLVEQTEPTTAPATPSPTPTPLPPSATPSPIASPTPGPTLSLNLRLEKAGRLVQDANNAMAQENYAEAVSLWDRVLAQVPEYGEGYYQQAQAYVALSRNQRFQDEYVAYLERARVDIDRAIALGPASGDHYYLRYRVYDYLASNATYRVDYDAWLELALADLQMANALGVSDPVVSERGLPLVYDFLGRCEEGMAEAKRLAEVWEAARNPPSADLNYNLAEGYLCLGQLEPALEHVEVAIGVYPNSRERFAHAVILYNMGRLDDALAQLNETIEDYPYYCGCRYFLRALIYYEQGKPDLARADLEFGVGETWERAGMLAYMKGRLLIDDGQTEEGWQQIQLAEATLARSYGPLLNRIREEIQQQGLPLLTPEPQTDITATPMPSPPLRLTPRPPLAAGAPPSTTSLVVDLATGTGPITFGTNSKLYLRFQPASPIAFQSVQSLAIQVERLDSDDLTGLSLEIWDWTMGEWRPRGISVGNFPVNQPGNYVGPEGDVYVRIGNSGTHAIQLGNIGLTFVTQQTDGTTAQYGLPSR